MGQSHADDQEEEEDGVNLVLKHSVSEVKINIIN